MCHSCSIYLKSGQLNRQKNAVHVGRNPGRFITFSGYQIPSPQSFQLLASLPHIHKATQCNFFHMMEHTRLAKAFVFCFKEYLPEGIDIRTDAKMLPGLVYYATNSQTKTHLFGSNLLTTTQIIN